MHNRFSTQCNISILNLEIVASSYHDKVPLRMIPLRNVNILWSLAHVDY